MNLGPSRTLGSGSSRAGARPRVARTWFPATVRVVLALVLATVFLSLAFAVVTARPGLTPSSHRPSAGTPPVVPAAPSPPLIGGRPLGEVISELERAIPEAMAEARVPGVSVALIAGHEVVWTAGFGVGNATTGTPVTAATVFRGASFSKNLVAFAALRLVDDGVLELDRPLAEYCPEPYVPDARVRGITLRMVLSHTSGFEPLNTGGRGVILFTPGERYSYSNNAFLYLQWVIESLTGRPLAAYMAETVFTPLGLTGTSFLLTPEIEPLVARGHEDGRTLGSYRPAAANAAYGVFTTPTDFARFMIHITRPDGEAGLSPETTAAMLSSQSIVVRDYVYWGLGWGLERTENGDFMWQWGWKGGFRAFAAADWREGLGVVIMTNSDTGMIILEELAAIATGTDHPALSHYLKSADD